MTVSAKPRKPRLKVVRPTTEDTGAFGRSQVRERIAYRVASRRSRGPDAGPFRLAPPLPGVVPPGFDMAADEAITGPLGWAQGAVSSAIEEGQAFLGYAYLSELAQRPEYRLISGVLAEEATREWIELKSAGDEDRTDQIEELTEALDGFGVRALFKKMSEYDGFFGRMHLYVDTGATDDREELTTAIGDGRSALSRYKVKRKGLKGLIPVEPIWTYPTRYEAVDPLKPTWYRPQTWHVMGKEVHRTRLLTFIAREVPDMLKPAYQFGGLSLSQMSKPYVDNWLRTRQSISDLIHSRIVWVLLTKLDIATMPAFQLAEDRARAFNDFRDNNNLMMLDKATEEFKNVEGSLAGLHELQAQSQEQMASITQIPVVKLLGVQPAGLNASSEGELKCWEDRIHAYQEFFFRPHLRTVIAFVQLHLWGKVDPSVVFDFKKLRQLTDLEIATLQKTLADTRAVDIEYGIVGPEEARRAIAGDPDSQYAGLKLDEDDVPSPPSEAAAGEPPAGPTEDPEGGLGAVRGADPGRQDEPRRLLRRALGGARNLNAMDLALDGAFVEQYGVAIAVDPTLTRDVAEPRIRLVARTIDDLRARFGFRAGNSVDPRSAGVVLINLRRPDAVEGCAGDYEAGVINLASDLDLRSNRLYPGIRKVAAGETDRDPLSLPSVLRHEVGHAWLSRFLAASGFDLAGEYGQALPTTVERLSKYSAEGPEGRPNAEEWFAESFGAYTHPEFASSGIALHPPLLRQFERLIPKRAGGAVGDDAGFEEGDHPRDEAGKFARASAAGAGGVRTHETSGAALPPHITALRIPPAWTDVRYDPDPDAALLAVGRDAKGREQRVYSKRFAGTQAEAKFRRIEELDKKFDRVREENDAARKDPRRRDVAEALALIMATGIRPGSDEDTRADRRAYGATTLEGRHVHVGDNGSVRLRFVGKKGADLDILVDDPDIESMLRDRAARAGAEGRLFPDATSGRLLAHFHSLDGGSFKTKDFRTLIGTKAALREVGSIPTPSDPKAYRRAVMAVAKRVAAVLGNTPTVALQAYIAPEVFGGWRAAAGV